MSRPIVRCISKFHFAKLAAESSLKKEAGGVLTELAELAELNELIWMSVPNWKQAILSAYA